MIRLLISLVILMLLTLGCYKQIDTTPDYTSAVLPQGLSGQQPTINEDHLVEIDSERIQLTKEYLRLHNRALYHRQSRNKGVEGISFDPRIVVVHYTVIPTLEKVTDYFKKLKIESSRETIAANGALNVGIHFVVDRDGAIYRMYPETVMARHCIGLNHVSIGIENIGDGDLNDENAAHPLTDAQLKANADLVRYLAGKYPNLDYMIAHSEYRDLEDHRHPAHSLFREDKPLYRTEKSDPGRRFMEGLRKQLGN